MEAKVTVEMTDVSDQGTSTAITYLVTNHSTFPIWLVNDEWFVWNQTNSEVEISFARGRMQKGAQVFGYFPPETIEIPPSGRQEKRFTLGWPQRLSRIWNAAEVAERPPGRFRLSVRIGYGKTPEPEPPTLGEGVEAPVLRWQREAVSRSVVIERDN